MTRKDRGWAFVAGALTGLGLYGIGAGVMNKIMPHGDALKPLWHENTIGLAPTHLVMIFIGLVMLAVLFVLDAEGKHSTATFLKFTAAAIVFWAVMATTVS